MRVLRFQRSAKIMQMSSLMSQLNRTTPDMIITMVMVMVITMVMVIIMVTVTATMGIIRMFILMAMAVITTMAIIIEITMVPTRHSMVLDHMGISTKGTCLRPSIILI